jgi:hypothetical protein
VAAVVVGKWLPRDLAIVPRNSFVLHAEHNSWILKLLAS